MDRLERRAEPPPERVAEARPALVVGASLEVRARLRERLADGAWAVREAEGGADALEKLMEGAVDLVLLDGPLPDLRAGEFRELVEAEWPETRVVTLEELAEGGSTAAARPVAKEERVRAPVEWVAGAGIEAGAGVGVGAGRGSRGGVGVGSVVSWQGMVGGSEAMQRVYRSVRLVSRRDTSVLVQGESGTGKDLVAQAVHAVSGRSKQPFVVINCAAIPEALLEAELFGYTKGAFTGAVQSRIGRLHAAQGGTLFLDEIGEMPVALQSKLLRFLEQGEVQRIGGSETLRVDVRVVAATNADLKKMAGAGTFREDLYYRLAVFPIRVPPLRERMEDLPGLVEVFLERFAPGVRVSSEAWGRLEGHSWPGNVRELRNVMERASLFAEGGAEIGVEDVVL